MNRCMISEKTGSFGGGEPIHDIRRKGQQFTLKSPLQSDTFNFKCQRISLLRPWENSDMPASSLKSVSEHQNKLLRGEQPNLNPWMKCKCLKFASRRCSELPCRRKRTCNMHIFNNLYEHLLIRIKMCLSRYGQYTHTHTATNNGCGA